jgi:2-polyprenyl-3-methyl-5-hydroxy-6-metoxy-1,4-benzoquinol methylase
MTDIGTGRTPRQQHEAEVYDARAARFQQELSERDLVVDPDRPPYPNREHVDFLDFVFRRLGDVTGKRILEVGCGSGNISTYLALRGASAVGVDVSAGMLALARRRAEVNGVQARVELLEAPIEDLDEPAESFDAVIANQVLHHLDLPRAMPNIARLVGDRGVALFVEPVLLLPEWVRTLRYSRFVTRTFPSRADTPDERSIDMRDLATIRGAFACAETYPFQLTTRVQNFVDLSDPIFARLERIDRNVLAHVGPAWRLARYLVLMLSGDPCSGTSAHHMLGHRAEPARRDVG